MRQRFNYTAQYYEKFVKQHDYVRWLFSRYGVPLYHLEKLVIKLCHDNDYVSSYEYKKKQHVIEIDYKMLSPDLFNIVLHEINHMLRQITKTPEIRKHVWDEDHDAEEHECVMYEMGWLKEQGLNFSQTVEHLDKGITDVQYPIEFLFLLWGLI